MDDKELAELAALPALMQYLIAERKPKHDDPSDPMWRTLFEDANYLARRFSATYVRNKRD